MIAGALAAFVMSLPAMAAAGQNGRAQTRQSASPAAFATITNKTCQDFGRQAVDEAAL
jgi:hypothetical protein